MEDTERQKETHGGEQTIRMISESRGIKINMVTDMFAYTCTMYVLHICTYMHNTFL